MKIGASLQKIGISSYFNYEQPIAEPRNIKTFKKWTYADSNGGPHRCQQGFLGFET